MYYKDSLRYRQGWLGIATLLILLFHFPIKIRGLWALQTFGYGGVDICLFASGAGCFFSLCGNGDVGAFLKRRLHRLAPACILTIGFWLVFRFVIGQFDVPMAVGNLLGLQSFTNRGLEFNWYISAILLFYFLAPYLKVGAERFSPVGKVLLLLFLLICTVPFWNVNGYMIIVTRLPIFYAGMLLGDLSKRGVRVKSAHILWMAVSFVVGILTLWLCYWNLTPYLWSHGLFWLPFLLIVPPLCIGLSLFLALLNKWKVVRRIPSFLSHIGDYSLELYLMQVLWVVMTPTFINKFRLQAHSDAVWTAGVVAVILGSLILKQCTKVLDRYSHKKARTIS